MRSATGQTYREIVVFLPNEGPNAPTETARQLADALNVGRAERGVDALTGNVELRLYYDPAVLEHTLDYLHNAGVVHEIHLR